MISLSKILEGKPLLLTGSIYFYQPTLSEITAMGEMEYWSALNLWMLKRNDILLEETEETKQYDDYTIWLQYIQSTPMLRKALVNSCAMLLKSKVEFFDISGTIYIGEKQSGVILDNTFYLLMKEICSRMTITDSSASEKGSQYKETENMSELERKMIAKMKSSEKKIEQVKNPNQKPEDVLGDRILGLVAVGEYTFEQVYNMTMLQFNMLLQKYIEIQTFELHTVLSPYISSEDGQNNKFWLN